MLDGGKWESPAGWIVHSSIGVSYGKCMRPCRMEKETLPLPYLEYPAAVEKHTGSASKEGWEKVYPLLNLP